MIFLVVVLVLLAAAYAGAAMHAKILLDKGENKGDVETKIASTGASVMIIGVIATLALWPAGKQHWYESMPFAPIYKISTNFIKPDTKAIPKGQLKEAEKMDVIIRQVLIGALTSLLCGILAQVVVKSQAGNLTSGGGGSSSKMPKSGHASPWAR